MKPTKTTFYFSGELPAEELLRKENMGGSQLGVLLSYFTMRTENSVSRRRLRALLKERSKHARKA